MTIFLWDTSHYDGPLTSAIMKRAKVEGIVGVTAKIGEGSTYDDPGDAAALAAARDAGVEFVGGYFVPRSTSPVSAQVDACIRLADRDEPWWRTFPGWFWQVDLERWPTDSVPASVGIDFAKQLRARTGRWTILYASKGQYGDGLTAWDGPLWNANYGSNPIGDFHAVYPGDTSPRWGAYSGKVPTFLQYSSNATIAGLTTCDANAYRGGVDQLRALIQGAAEAATTRGDRMIVMAHERGSNVDWAGDGVFRYQVPDSAHRANLLVVMGLQGDPNPSSVEFNPGTLDALGPVVVSASSGVPTVGGEGVVVLSDAQLAAIAAQVTSAHDALTDADKPTIVDAVKSALRTGTG